MDWQSWYSLGVVAFCFGMLAFSRVSPDIVTSGGLTLVLVAGVLTPEEALAGFANEGMLTVAVLYVVVTGLTETGAVNWIVQNLLGRPRSATHAQARLMLPVATLSAFLNNTPVVAIFIPAVQDWARRHRLMLSRLLIPLSFASIAGGTCTLIGTSTNLVVNGLLTAETEVAGFALFGDASPFLLAFVQAFAAGAILTMLANSMMPEAFEQGGKLAGLATVWGFSTAVLVVLLERGAG